ncbi:hypothetical protein SAMN05428989_2771 [Pseudoxanthomonas sp. GM95]|uniref:hypothetical protein n=1 Tax=Pseudoxanthomonas sp. GM95 TaxID=1881043 RepID=UPI0008C697E3|nr:hypothetical protein [Pseudoxanthomonas sp. GM95]SEL88144.1 hypothetical protein SAMN05428989_2771 [Pseudoxanthomonas sp. GM95]
MKAPIIPLISALLLALPLAAGAQQLNQPNKVEPFRPISSSSNGSNTLPAPQPAQKSSVRSDASQRTAAPKVAADTGIVQQRPEQPASTQPDPTPKPIHVTDARGQPVTGAVEVAPNRVMDPKTGRVYSTVPAGDGQRIIEPPKK